MQLPYILFWYSLSKSMQAQCNHMNKLTFFTVSSLVQCRTRTVVLSGVQPMTSSTIETRITGT